MTYESKELAPPNLGQVLDVLGLAAEWASVADPTGVAAGVSAGASTARMLLSRLEDKQEDRRRQRLRMLLDDLRRRLEAVERAVNPPVDLFSEMLLKAIQEEDDRKIPLQGAVIEWVASTRPDAALARLAMVAVSELSFVELQSFISWCRYDGRLRLPHGWHDNQVWARLHHYGLISQTGVISRGNITLIGRTLAQRCPELALDERTWNRMN